MWLLGWKILTDTGQFASKWTRVFLTLRWVILVARTRRKKREENSVSTLVQICLWTSFESLLVSVKPFFTIVWASQRRLAFFWSESRLTEISLLNARSCTTIFSASLKLSPVISVYHINHTSKGMKNLFPLLPDFLKNGSDKMNSSLQKFLFNFDDKRYLEDRQHIFEQGLAKDRSFPD